MKLSNAINNFHSVLSLYIAGGWMLSYIHNRILLLLIHQRQKNTTLHYGYHYQTNLENWVKLQH